MNRKKQIALMGATLSISLLALSGCTQSSPPTQSNVPQPSDSAQIEGGTQSTDLLARIQEKGEIVIAMEGTWAPWTYHDETVTLRAAIDQALSELAADGTLAALSNQYFGTDISQNQQSNQSVER